MREGLWWNVDMTRQNLTSVFTVGSKKVCNQFGKFIHGISCLNSTIAKAFVNTRRIFSHLYHALYYFEPSSSSPSLSTFHVLSKPHGDLIKRVSLQGRNIPSSTPPPPPRLVMNLWRSHCTTWAVFTFAVYLTMLYESLCHCHIA